MNEAERVKVLEALLREARDSVERDYLDCDTGLTDSAREDLLARIDRALQGEAGERCPSHPWATKGEPYAVAWGGDRPTVFCDHKWHDARDGGR